MPWYLECRNRSRLVIKEHRDAQDPREEQEPSRNDRILRRKIPGSVDTFTTF